MARPLKIALAVVGAVVLLFIVAAVSFVLLFDPNDFRERIAAETREATGRELLIEGDLDVSFFPWLAIGMGKTSLGNAPGFGDAPFASFDSAKLSVRLLPLLFGGNVSIGTAELNALHVNLAVARNGRSNWQDLLRKSDDAAAPDVDAIERPSLDIASINVNNASLTYNDAQLGETYLLTDINLASGKVAAGEAIPLTAGFNFELQPADLRGDFELDTTVSFDADEQTITLGEVEMSLVGVDMTANFEPIDYSTELVMNGTLAVDAFSLPALMTRLDIEPPVTVDPNALGKIYLDAQATITTSKATLADVKLVIDDTTMRGEVTLALDGSGRIGFGLKGDSIDLDRYMEPVPDAGSGAADEVPVEIPVDLIRTLNLSGSLQVDSANLTGLRFENVDVKIQARDGDLRLRPITADLFDGTYKGDVRINASGSTPVLSVNENVDGVNLGSLARAMFDTRKVTGTISGSFVLSGSGADLAAIQQDLDGTLNFELLDGAFEGTDVWYELRRARALLKQEPAPEPVLPARTRFSNVRASGPVTDGLFQNNDLLAELPFMRLTGKGSVDLPKATIDYQLTARVLEKPEFVNGATEEELKEFTEAVIPLRITGPLASPSIKPDLEGMLKKRVKKELEDRLRDRLLGGKEETVVEDEAAEGELTEKQKKKRDREELLEDALKDIFKN